MNKNQIRCVYCGARTTRLEEHKLKCLGWQHCQKDERAHYLALLQWHHEFRALARQTLDFLGLKPRAEMFPREPDAEESNHFGPEAQCWPISACEITLSLAQVRRRIYKLLSSQEGIEKRNTDNAKKDTATLERKKLLRQLREQWARTHPHDQKSAPQGWIQKQLTKQAKKGGAR